MRKNLTLLFVSIVLSVVLVEIVLRIFVPFSVITDEKLGWIRRPGGEWDSDGFRNEKTLMESDIVAIGDSMTMGDSINEVPINKAWPQQLSSISSKSVYQMALGGYGPVQYSYLIDRAISKKPETIILGFYLGNDLYDVHRMVYENEYWRDLRSGDFSIDSPSEDEFFDYWQGLNNDFAKTLYDKTSYLRSHSRLFSIFSNIYWNIYGGNIDNRLSRVGVYSELNPDKAYVFNNGNIRAILNSEYRFKYMDLNETAISESWRISQNLFSEIKNKLESNNINLIITIIPTKEMVFEEWFKQSGHEKPKEFNGVHNIESRLRDEIFKFCRASDIRCLDLLPSLASALNSGVKIYPEGIDGHPTIYGYEVIAKTIHSYILNIDD